MLIININQRNELDLLFSAFHQRRLMTQSISEISSLSFVEREREREITENTPAVLPAVLSAIQKMN